MPFARALAEFRDRLLDLGERKRIRIAHHRHHQPALGANRDADMIIILVDDVGAVDLRVYRRNVFERMHAGLHEEAHEAELHAVLLLEALLVMRAQVHHRAHVHLVERGEHGRRVLRLLQAPRDGLPQPRHAHALFARRIARRRGRSHADGSRRRCHACDRRQQVALHHTAVLAAARYARGIDAGLGGQFTHRRHQGSIRDFLRGDRSRRRRRLRCGHGLGRRLRLGLGRRLGATGALVDRAQQRADRDRVAVLGRDRGERAGDRRRHLDRHLVGLELHQRLVRRHRLARFLEPAADRGLGHQLAEGRDADFDGHVLALPAQPSASSRNAVSCIMWRDISPVAVEAEAARPT